MQETGKCPVTQGELALDDLLPLATNKTIKPRATPATSIPGLLGLFHDEWDALMLETHALRTALHTSRQELSHALYQHDAACRVIAKLMKEKDELRHQLSQHLGRTDDAAADEQADEDKPVLPDNIVAEIDDCAKRLKTARKNREIPRTLAAPARLSSFVEVDCAQNHSDRTGFVPVHCVSVSEAYGNRLIFSGGADGKAVCYDADRKAVASTLIGHTKAIRQIRACDDSVVTCSDDGTTRYWKNDGGAYRCAATMHAHQGAVTGFSVLPSNKNIITSGSDGCLVFSDLHTGTKIATGRSPESALGISCVELHPDGYFAACGSANKVLIWDLKHMEVQHVLHETDGNVTDVSFNPMDPLKLAVSTTRGVIKIWDLRNTDVAPTAITFDDSPPSKPVPVNRIAFEACGAYLAVATNTVKIWDFKHSTLLASLATHLDPVTDISWGVDAQWLSSSSMDRSVRSYAAAN